MSKLQLVSIFLVCLFPISPIAADPVKVLPTPREQIHFDDVTSRAFDRSGKFVTSSTKSDGTVHTELNGSFQNVMVARMGQGGVIETYCTTSGEDAKNWMARVDDQPENATIEAQVEEKTP